MKKIIFALTFCLLSQFSLVNAAVPTEPPLPGVQVHFDLKCLSSTLSTDGELYKLRVVAQVVEPQYIVRSILIMISSQSNETSSSMIQLDPVSQTDNTATFSLKEYEAKLDKLTFSAVLKFGSNDFTCK